MNKIKKLLVFLLAVVVLVSCVAFVGCNKSIEGEYKLESISYYDDDIENIRVYKVGDSYGGRLITEDMVSLTVYENNKYVFTSSLYYSSKPQTGSMTEYEGVYYLDYDSEASAIVSGNRIKVISDSLVITLVKK